MPAAATSATAAARIDDVLASDGFMVSFLLDRPKGRPLPSTDLARAVYREASCLNFQKDGSVAASR
jgi:hypothetical protein